MEHARSPFAFVLLAFALALAFVSAQTPPAAERTVVLEHWTNFR